MKILRWLDSGKLVAAGAVGGLSLVHTIALVRGMQPTDSMEMIGMVSGALFMSVVTKVMRTDES